MTVKLSGAPRDDSDIARPIAHVFRFARGRKNILADPTRGLAAREPRGFTGQTLPLEKQRELFRSWTTAPDTHPHEALLGILALLHGASSDEVRHLCESGIDRAARTAELGSRPLPVPLDPASWQILQRCLDHREIQRTANPHVIVTKGTKAGRPPASTAYVSHVLHGCGIPPRALRCTRLADLVNTMDPKLAAAAFGMKPEGIMYYLADLVDAGRLTAPSTSTSEALPVEPSPVLGASRSLIEGAWNWPVHGLRYPSTPGTTGWYVWTGELSDADDFFQPWHAIHLIEHCPGLGHLLDLPPGSRFVFAPGYGDVWNDPSLLDP